jgi:hypothetical protein
VPFWCGVRSGLSPSDDQRVTQPGPRKFLANVRWEQVWGPGSVTISSDAVEVAGLRRQDRLSPTRVTVDTAILWVPWANVYVRLVDPEVSRPPVVAVPLWMRRTIARTFEQAGYAVTATRHVLPSTER